MENGRRGVPYCCTVCGAHGELPLVEGETSCPHCGEHLWRVRSSAGYQSGSGITPAGGLPLLPGRPPLSTRGVRSARLRVFLFRPIIVLWLIFRQRIMETRVNTKLDEISVCRNRHDLEQLLGKPVYAVDGEALQATDEDDGREAPDLIECYESEGCCIDLWFRHGQLVDVSGFVKPTRWDIAMTQDLDLEGEDETDA